MHSVQPWVLSACLLRHRLAAARAAPAAWRTLALSVFALEGVRHAGPAFAFRWPEHAPRKHRRLVNCRNVSLQQQECRSCHGEVPAPTQRSEQRQALTHNAANPPHGQPAPRVHTHDCVQRSSRLGSSVKRSSLRMRYADASVWTPPGAKVFSRSHHLVQLEASGGVVTIAHRRKHNWDEKRFRKSQPPWVV
jgi:hypothetical protein